MNVEKQHAKSYNEEVDYISLWDCINVSIKIIIMGGKDLSQSYTLYVKFRV